MIGGSLFGLFIDANNTIYVTQAVRNRVQVWLEGNSVPSRNISIGLNYTFSVFAQMNGDVFIDNGLSNHRIDKWTSNATNGSTIMYVPEVCYDLFVDLANNLYCALSAFNKVMRTSLANNTNNSIVVAGNGTTGSGSYMLNTPSGIFVDARLNLYVADSRNDRIQYFRSGSLNGTTLVGNGSNETIVLRYPISIVMDADGYLFICTNNANQIIGSSSAGFRCIIGCTNGSGSGADQLNAPASLRFDSYGNIFVVDAGNGRIQNFSFEASSCSMYSILISSICEKI